MTVSVLSRLFALVLLIAFLDVPSQRVQATPLFTSVPVSDSGTTNHLASASSSRTVAVAVDGTMYVTYRGSNGIRVARSLDGGQSFRASVRITTTDAAAEVAVDTDGIVYVAWITGGKLYVSRSTNRGTSFSTPTAIGSSSGSTVHIATDAPFVYLLPNTGTKLFRNDNQGAGTFLTSTPFSSVTTPYADVQVDPASGTVFVLGDYTLKYVTSNDHGATFGSPVTPGGSVYYSTTALSVGPRGRWLLVGGQDSTAYRVNLDTATSEAFSFRGSSSGPTRVLATDPCGDVVEGHSGNASGAYAVSQALGQNFSAEIGLSGSVASLGLAVNPTNGDIGVAYELGGQIFASVFTGELSTCPVLTTNNALTLDEGGASLVTSNNLRVVDPNRTIDQIVYMLATSPSHGTLQSGDTTLGVGQTFTEADIDGGSVLYTHDGSESTSDGFTFSVADGAGGAIGVTTFAIGITPVNDPPQAANDVLTTIQGQLITFNVLANDSDPEGGPLTVRLINAPASGTAELSADGTLSYTPQPAFTGTDTLTYEVQDNQGSSASATVTITIRAAADLTVSMSATPSSTTPSSPLVYTLDVANRGPSDATDVVLTPHVTVDGIPSSVQISGDACRSDSATACFIDALAAGSTATVTVVATPQTNGVATISAEVASSTLDPNPTDNITQDQITVGVRVYLPVVVRGN